MKQKILQLLITSFTVFSFSAHNKAQTPSLGTAASFVLFTGTGAVTNTGISQVTGNVGTNSGAITGFGNVNGVIHTGDGTTLQCAADLTITYNLLNTMASTASHAPLLGNGETLTAGVYAIAGNTTLSNSLTLDALGNANAVFIFQISAPLSTTASSQIILSNGAQACNVFWKVEGAVNMAALTVMRGTVIANNAAIDMSTGVTLEGRALSTAGAVTLNGILAYIPTGCGSAVLTGPPAPNLGSAACYALFSGNGGVTNAGITSVTGDVGTNVGLTTGFDPLRVNGTIHPIPDGSTAACAADLLNVYNYLNTLPFDIELFYPAQFGHNLVLTPHTYLLNAAADFTDTLYLNAANNPDAVFVIKINGALTTSTFAKVILINGTQAKNVFWKVDGAVSINDYSIFKGTIVCNNAAINLNTGTALEGRALTTNGAFSTSAITATGAATCGTLPLTLLSFSGYMHKGGAVLSWQTTNEQNTLWFEVEQSVNGINYVKEGTVPATGTSGGVSNYSFTERNTAALNSSINYYRLRLVDADGKFKYSAILILRSNAKGTMLQFYPNPVNENAAMTIAVEQTQIITCSIIDNAGRVISSRVINLTAGTNVIDMNVKELAAGLYSLRIAGLQATEKIRFVKQ